MGRIFDLFKKSVGDDAEKLKEHEAEIKKLDDELEKPKPKAEEPKPKEKPQEQPQTPVQPVKVKSGDGTEVDIAGLVTKAVSGAVAAGLKPVNDRLDKIEQQDKAREDSERDTAIVKILDDAVAKGKIEPEKRDSWKSDLEASFETTKGILERMSENPALAKKNGDGSKKDDDKKDDTKLELGTRFAQGANQDILKAVTEQLA